MSVMIEARAAARRAGGAAARQRRWPSLDHALGQPHHRRARGFSAPSRRTPREAARTMAPRLQAYVDGPWVGGHPVGILPRR